MYHLWQVFTEVAENECIIISEVIYYGSQLVIGLIVAHLGGTWGRICLLDIRSSSTLKVLCNRALKINVYLLTNVILVFGCIAQLWHMANKNWIAQHDVGLCKHVAV